MSARIVNVRQKVLRKNDGLAAELRERYRAAGVVVINLVSSPGSGKTSLLEHTLEQLDLRAAVIVGDLATENDATRLARSGAPVRQISTGTTCHLEADMVERALEDWDLSAFDILFIENVGNLVCPASWDLGEDARVVLLSTTEGEDKPLKYPTIFNTADLAVLTKMDLADVLGFDRTAAVESVHDVRPGLPILDTSSRGEPGLDAWLDWLRARHAEAATRIADPV
ncbi:MAG: hydrogenase nickel incorporation protein HypB [Bacteroidota bacterium]